VVKPVWLFEALDGVAKKPLPAARVELSSIEAAAAALLAFMDVSLLGEQTVESAHDG
jgi:hypothetical protein